MVISALLVISTLFAAAGARPSGPQPAVDTDLIQRGVSICGRGPGARGPIPTGAEGAPDGYQRTMDAKFVWYTMTKDEGFKDYEKAMLEWAVEANCGEFTTYQKYCPCFGMILNNARRDRKYAFVKMMEGPRKK